jgi:hypothetical protein
MPSTAAAAAITARAGWAATVDFNSYLCRLLTSCEWVAILERMAQRLSDAKSRAKN